MTPQNDLDETLDTPRFDAAEAQAARPVEPLAQERPDGRAGFGRLFNDARRTLRHSWPLALVVSLLTAGVVVGATVLINKRQPTQSATTAQQVNAPATTATNTTQPETSASVAPATRARTERREVVTPRRAQPAAPQAEQPAAEDIGLVVEDFSRLGRDAERGQDRDDKRADRKERKRKHRGRDGDDDEDIADQSRKKKDGKHGGAILLDVIRDH